MLVKQGLDVRLDVTYYVKVFISSLTTLLMPPRQQRDGMTQNRATNIRPEGVEFKSFTFRATVIPLH